MKKIFIISLIITFHITQYTYLQAARSLCDPTEGIFNSTVVERPEPEELELMFDQLGLNEKVELINYTEAYKVKYLGAEFCYVPLYDENRYVFVTMDGSLLGGINQHQGKRDIILSQNIQPKLMCVMICFLINGQSSFSIVACPQLFIAKTLYPYDIALHDALERTCLNGVISILWTFVTSYRFCYLNR